MAKKYPDLNGHYGKTVKVARKYLVNHLIVKLRVWVTIPKELPLTPTPNDTFSSIP